MSKKQGFTIIELMIVVAIIGVISAIVMPIFLDYMLRGKVAESASLLGGTKGPLMEYYQDRNSWPELSVIGAKTQGNYVQKVFTGGALPVFYVEAVIKDGLGKAGGRSLRLEFRPADRSWRCTTDGTTLPLQPELLPAPCRD